MISQIISDPHHGAKPAMAGREPAQLDAPVVRAQRAKARVSRLRLPEETTRASRPPIPSPRRDLLLSSYSRQRTRRPESPKPAELRLYKKCASSHHSIPGIGMAKPSRAQARTPTTNSTTRHSSAQPNRNAPMARLPQSLTIPIAPREVPAYRGKFSAGAN